MKQRVAVLLVLGLMPWAELHAQSQQMSTTFRVSAHVEAVCEVTATDLSFGTYTSQGGTPLQGTTLLRATCTPSLSYNIRLNDGTSPGATVNQRRMVLGTNAFSTTGTDTVNGVGTGLSQDHTIVGAVPAAQVIPAGGYADTTTVRIYY
jgi:spore coat protein U-like protein